MRKRPSLDASHTARAPVTVAEWDVTPGLHEWIEQQIVKAEAEPPPHGQWCNAHPTGGCGCGLEPCDCDGFDSANCDCPWPAAIVRQSAAARKILAAHEYAPFDSKYSQGVGFGCGACHADGDGFGYAGGNCATVLALAEAYGLDEPGEQDVEVIRD